MSQPDGLLAIGGDLSPGRILAAYRRGIFPWYSDDQPILWWSPNPRMVLFPENLKVSRSLGKNIRNGDFTVTVDKAFQAVLAQCAIMPRKNQHGTWITREMQAAYTQLHMRGFAHSIECWQDGQLVGGLYGIAIGRVFFGESMFSRSSNASKVAFVKFVQQIEVWGYELIDCQVYSEHLATLGACKISRQEFKQLLDYCDLPGKPLPWPKELV